MDFDRMVDAVIIAAILTVIGLKIVGVITLSWLWLLSPFIFLLGIGIIMAIVLILMCIISIYINKRR